MSAPSASWSSAWQWSFIALLLVAGAIPALLSPVNGDVAWLLYAAQRVTEGSTLYVDLIEINPPLIVWLSIPAVWLADLLGTSTMAAFALYVLGVSAGSLLLVHRVLHVGSGLRAASRRGFLALFAFAAITLSGIMFGQREQLMLVATAPYAALVAVRLRGGEIGGALALVVGVLGGIGFAIKPHFVLIWLGLELLVWSAASRSRALRPEVFGVVAVGVTYAFSVVLLAPEYLTLVDRLGTAYAGHRQESLRAIATDPFTIALAVGLLYYRLVGVSGLVKSLVQVSGVFATSVLLVVAIQGQGFYYHWYPMLAWLIVMLGVQLWGRVARTGGKGPLRRRIAWIAAGVMLVALTSLAGRSSLDDVLLRDYDRKLNRVAYHLRSTAATDSFTVGVVSPQHKSAYPLVMRAGARSIFRFNGFWPITVLCDSSCRADLTYADGSIRPGSTAEHFFRTGTIEDLTGEPADFLLVDEFEIDDTFRDHRFNYMAYFAADSMARTVLASYACGEELEGYLICRR